VTSSDGTAIALWVSGTGPALVVVHGTAADSGAFARVAPLLSEAFTVYRMDRRGRGESGDGPDYSFGQEVDDVIATVKGAMPGPPYLYGHSFGGALAWEAARRLPELAGLVLYEGGPKPPIRFIPDELITELQTLIDAGRDEEALTRFLLTAAGLSETELLTLRQQPAWPGRVSAAHTIPRELRANNDYAADSESFEQVLTPVLLLLGSRSLQRRRVLFRDLVIKIHHARIVELADQGHAANTTAPQLLADAIREFPEVGLQAGQAGRDHAPCAYPGHHAEPTEGADSTRGWAGNHHERFPCLTGARSPSVGGTTR
jgi:pimeloyl-ACP methyl ester carboxylesterase